MTISVGQKARPEPADRIDGFQEACAGKSGWRLITILSVRSLLAVWALLSMLWGASVGYNIYHRATVQADMSRDVERDLDQSFINASCKGASCAGEAPKASSDATQNWSDIASTYFQFDSMEIGEYALGPPLAVLAVGLAALVAIRRRRRSG